MKIKRRFGWIVTMSLLLTLWVTFPAYAEPESGSSEEHVLIGGDFATTYQDVIEEVRDHLTAHESEFSVKMDMENGYTFSLQDVDYSLVQYASVHTGVPNQGDYIAQNINSFYSQIEGTQDSTWTHITITFTVDYYAPTKAREQQVDEKVAEIITALDLDGLDDLEKIRKIYDYVCRNVTYDNERLEDPGTVIEHSTYAALCEGKAVCQGYASAIYRLMLTAGIDCRVITGYWDAEPHAWNIVKYDGKYYLLDATADSGRTQYAHFMKCEADFDRYHPDEKFTTDEFKMQYPISEESYTESTDPVTKEYNGFTYQTDGESISILAYNGTETDVVIPASIGGVPVVEVGKYTFSQNKTVETITISEGIQWVSSLFASSCFELRSISIPSTARLAGSDGLVAYCAKLEEIRIADGNPYFSVQDGVIYNAEKTAIITCPSCLDQKVITIPEGVTVISSECFSENKVVEEVILPDSVTSIGYWAFNGATNLKKVNIPAACECIGQYAFQRTALEELVIPASYTGVILEGAFAHTNVRIIVEEGNPIYQVVDDCLLTNKNTVLHYYEADGAETVTVPDGMKYIALFAFAGSTNLKKVVLCDGIVSIGSYAFEGCSALDTIQLPDSLEKIGGSAFSSCTALKEMVLPENLKELKGYVFSSSGLEYISIGPALEQIDKNTFYSIASLKSIDVDPQNEQFASIDGSLYSKDRRRLILVPANVGCTINFPEELQAIETWAMNLCKFHTVVVPDGVTTIGTHAFNQNAVKDLVLPKSIASIADNGIWYSGKVHYEGTEEDWNNIEIGTGNDSFTLYYEYDSEADPMETSAHVVVTDTGYAATCTQAGLTDGSHCSVCKAVLTEQTEIPAKGHKEVTDAAVAATCTKDGLTAGSHCSVCNEVIKAQQTVKASGHQWDEGTVTKKPICVSTGEKIYKCKKCGTTRKETLSATAHTVVTDAAVPATTTSTGLTEGSHCSVCGTIFKKQAIIAKIIPAQTPTTTPKTPAVKNGWKKEGGKWFYYLKDVKQKGWKQIGKKWYFFKKDGSMAANEWCQGYWLNKNGTWTYKNKATWKKDKNGWWFGCKGWYARNQWQKIDDKWYYFDAKGYITTGTKKIGGKTYRFNSSGACLNP